MSGIYENVEWNSRELPRSGKFNRWNTNLRVAMLGLSETVRDRSTLPFRVVGSNTPFLDRVYLSDACGTPEDRTNAVRHADSTPLVPDGWNFASGDFVLIGHQYPYPGVTFDFNPVAGGAVTLVWQYWDTSLSQWINFTSAITDGTTNWTSDGSVTWSEDDLPDWGAATLDEVLGITGSDSAGRFWIRVSITGGTPAAAKIDALTLSSDLRPLSVTQEYTRDGGSRYVRVMPGIAIMRNKLFVLEGITRMFVPIVRGYLNQVYSLMLNDNGLLSWISTDVDCSPVGPIGGDSQLKLADIEVRPGDNIITDSDITDTRV